MKNNLMKLALALALGSIFSTLVTSVFQVVQKMEHSSIEEKTEIPYVDDRFFTHFNFDSGEVALQILEERFSSCAEKQEVSFEVFRAYMKAIKTPPDEEYTNFSLVVGPEKVTYLFANAERFAIKSTYLLPKPVLYAEDYKFLGADYYILTGPYQNGLPPKYHYMIERRFFVEENYWKTFLHIFAGACLVIFISWFVSKDKTGGDVSM